MTTIIIELVHKRARLLIEAGSWKISIVRFRINNNKLHAQKSNNGLFFKKTCYIFLLLLFSNVEAFHSFVCIEVCIFMCWEWNFFPSILFAFDKGERNPKVACGLMCGYSVRQATEVEIFGWTLALAHHSFVSNHRHLEFISNQDMSSCARGVLQPGQT